MWRCFSSRPISACARGGVESGDGVKSVGGERAQLIIRVWESEGGILWKVGGQQKGLAIQQVIQAPLILLRSKTE